jgi:hypothetical protein
MNLCLLRVFSSLRLTVVLLALSMMLVFMATLAQTRLGIWEVMSRYIRTFVVSAADHNPWRASLGCFSAS